MLSQDVVRRLTVIASDTGLTTLKAKLDAVDHAQDRVAVSGTRMGSATEAAERRIQALVRQGGGLAGGIAGGLAGRAGIEALAMIGRFAPAVLVAYGSFKLLNATVAQGVALLEKYGLAGQRAMFGEGVDDALKTLTRFQHGDESLQQIKYASNLSGRLDEAQRLIKEFLKVEFDLTDPALKLMNVWVLINEQLAKAAELASKIPAPALRIGAGAVLGAIPGVGAVYTAGKIANSYLTPPEQPDLSEEESMRLARGRLSAGLGQDVVQRQLAAMDRDDKKAKAILNANAGSSFTARYQYDVGALAKKQDDSAPKKEEKNAFTRSLESISRSTAVAEANAKAVGAGAAAQARFRVEAELTEAALRSKLDPASKQVTDEIERLGARAGMAAEKLALLRLQSDATFERSQIGRDSTEAGVASRLRSVYGDNYESEMNGAVASAIRFNEQLRIGKDLAQQFGSTALSTFRSELDQGTNAWTAFGRAGLKALDSVIMKIADQTLQNGIAKLFGSFGGSSAGPRPAGGLFGGMIIPGILHEGGVVGAGALAGRYVHPAVFADANRFAAGGIAGIGPDEVPIVAHRNEEVIRRDDPRHRWNGGGGKSENFTYVDKRTFNDVTPQVEARLDARFRAERPKIIQEAMAAMQKRRGRDPNTFSAG